jgi:tetratricopeptide (TPR) repeat protein
MSAATLYHNPGRSGWRASTAGSGGAKTPDGAALAYNNLAANLDAQGKHAQAQPLRQKALLLNRKLLGEEHPATALSYNSVAFCLHAQGKHAQAQPLFEKALDLRKKALGEEHPATALSYNNLAHILQAQGKHAQALSLYQKALDLRKKLLGEDHPHTARSYGSLALNLDAQGRHGQAQPLHQKALDLWRKRLGEEHPETANSSGNLAHNLYAQGRHREAIRAWEAALLGHDAGRLARASSGFDRALFGANRLTPRQGLALPGRSRSFREVRGSTMRVCLLPSTTIWPQPLPWGSLQRPTGAWSLPPAIRPLRRPVKPSLRFAGPTGIPSTPSSAARATAPTRPRT